MGSYPYLIELRLGYADPKVRQTIRDIQHRFRFGRAFPKVPHMTLFGPFDLRTGHGFREVRRAIERSAENIHELPFTIDGWDAKTTQHGKVIAFGIDPSPDLQTFRRQLTAGLCPITVIDNTWDCSRDGGWFHITLAMRLTERNYRSVWNYLNSSPGTSRSGISSSLLSRLLSLIFRNPARQGGKVRPVHLPASGLRVAIILNRRILFEYDLLQKRWLDRREALDGREYARTLRHFRKYRGFELTTPNHRPQPTVFVIGDLHLGHANIIRYCSRPFPPKGVEEMDEVLIRNWNHCVRPTDTVYYLGDLAFGERSAQEYWRRLNGKITFIQGNHDDGIPDSLEELRIEYNNLDFLLAHDPKKAAKPDGFPGWVIHGHTHNNDLKRYPFFDPTNRKINVSAEVIGYQPIPLSQLCTLIQTRSDNIPTVEDC